MVEISIAAPFISQWAVEWKINGGNLHQVMNASVLSGCSAARLWLAGWLAGCYHITGPCQNYGFVKRAQFHDLSICLIVMVS